MCCITVTVHIELLTFHSSVMKNNASNTVDSTMHKYISFLTYLYVFVFVFVSVFHILAAWLVRVQNTFPVNNCPHLSTTRRSLTGGRRIKYTLCGSDTKQTDRQPTRSLQNNGNLLVGFGIAPNWVAAVFEL